MGLLLEQGQVTYSHLHHTSYSLTLILDIKSGTSSSFSLSVLSLRRKKMLSSKLFDIARNDVLL